MTGNTVVLPAAGPCEAGFWQAYAVTMRPYLLFVSGITGMAGVSLVSGVPAGFLLALGVVFFLAYGFGQALTDCFQTDTDSLSAPYRPLVRGAVRARDVFVVSLIGLVGCGAVLVVLDGTTLLPAAASVIGLTTYTWFKRRWWGGPWYNAWIVALLVVLGYQAGSGVVSMPAAPTVSLGGMVVASLAAYANFVLTGYYKDIEADRATGYNTLPVVVGRHASALVSDALVVLSFSGAVIVIWRATPAGFLAALPFVVGAAAAAALAQVRLHAVVSDSEAHRAIAPVVHEYVLLLAGLAASQQPLWFPALVLFYLAFVAALSRRPMEAQI